MEEKIASGAITLCHINVAQTVIHSERKLDNNYSARQKLELIGKLANKSIRDAEKIALTLVAQPAAMERDRIKTLAHDKVEMKFSADEAVEKKIQLLRGLLAHKNPNLTLGELFDKLCDLGIEQWTPKIERPKKVATLRKLTHAKGPESVKTSGCETFLSESPGRETLTPEIATPIKPISFAEKLRQVRKFAQNKCVNCCSTYAMEVDHIIRAAKGGSSELQNMRLLCRSCNQRAAIRELGADKMNNTSCRLS